VNTIPTYAMYNGYASIFLLVQGLQAAGANPTPASLIAGLSTIHAFTADGLFGSHSVDINNRTDTFNGADGCTWITELQGSTFHLVSGADPICGHIIPGKTVTP
jgi:branched-chain amino acid transport system substrate-binding protein